VQILHRFTGSIQRYSEELSDPDRYRPDHYPQCEAHRPLRAPSFYTRTLVDIAFDGTIRVRLPVPLLQAHGVAAAPVYIAVSSLRNRGHRAPF
jgi:hypothetical protein